MIGVSLSDDGYLGNELGDNMLSVSDKYLHLRLVQFIHDAYYRYGNAK